MGIVLEGVCVEYCQFDTKTGLSLFIVRQSGKDITVKGYIKEFQRNVPVKLTGEFVEENGKEIFRADDLEYVIISEDEATMMLARGVSGLGNRNARMIVDRFGKDLTKYCEAYGDSLKERLMELKGIGGSKANAIVDFLKTLKYSGEVYRKMIAFGIEYPQAVKIVAKYGSDGLNRAYSLVEEFDISFFTADRIGKAYGSDIWCEDRVRAAMHAVLRQNEMDGSTRMPLKEFLSECVRITGKYREPIPEILFFLKSMNSTDIEVYGRDRVTWEGDRKDVWVAFRNTDMAEDLIAMRLNDLAKFKNPLVPEGTIVEKLPEIEKEFGIHYNAGQVEALKLLETGGICVVTGGPGTGKTTLIKGILGAYLSVEGNSANDVLLCATTGKAATRMSQSIRMGFTASTVHKALGISPEEGAAKKIDRIEKRLIIIDEMSMCDTNLFAEIMKRIKGGSMLILVGDRDQLPSVGPGEIFGTLCDCGRIPVARLTETVRQKKDSGIIANAKRILNGENLCDSKDFRMIVTTDDNILAVAERLIPVDAQVLCPVKDGAAGVKQLNQMLHEKEDHEGKKSVRIGNTVYYEGDRVIMTRNHYEGENSYANGQMGTIASITGSIIELAIEDQLITIEAKDAGNMELSYAVTVHKYQGSENEEIFVVLPYRSMNLAGRKLLYTAITRAKERVTLIAEPRALDACIMNDREWVRRTALKEKISRML